MNSKELEKQATEAFKKSHRLVQDGKKLLVDIKEAKKK